MHFGKSGFFEKVQMFLFLVVILVGTAIEKTIVKPAKWVWKKLREL